MLCYSRKQAHLLTKQTSVLKCVSVYHVPHSAQASEKESSLIVHVETAMKQLEALGHPVTQTAISRMLRVPRHKFGMYPRIRTLFEQRADQYHHYQTKHREDELLIKVEEALRQLERLRMPLTQKNICAIVGKSPDALRRYPRVKDLLQQHNRLSQSRKRFLAKI